MLDFGLSSSSSELKEVVKRAGEVRDDLRKRLKKDKPTLVRSELGMELLKITHTPTWKEISSISNNSRKCFETWFNRKNIALDSLLPSNRRQKKDMDLYWIGIAALAALLGGASFYLRQREQEPDSELSEQTREDINPDRPLESKTQRTVQEGYVHRHLMAVAADAGSIREADAGSVQAAPDVLTAGTHWWTGKSTEWNEIESSEELRKIDQIPTADDKLLIVAYEFQTTGRKGIDSRVEATDHLREMKDEGDLEMKGMYELSDPLVLREFGFSR